MQWTNGDPAWVFGYFKVISVLDERNSEADGLNCRRGELSWVDRFLGEPESGAVVQVLECLGGLVGNWETGEGGQAVEEAVV